MKILADDTNPSVAGTLAGMFENASKSMRGANVNDEVIDKLRTMSEDNKKFEQMKNTIGKMRRDYKNPLHPIDFEIVDEFLENPKFFLDNDANIAIQLK